MKNLEDEKSKKYQHSLGLCEKLKLEIKEKNSGLKLGLSSENNKQGLRPDSMQI